MWNGEGTLLEILRHNNNTDYGQRYFFADLQSAEGYQIRVPLSSYSTYAPLIQLQTTQKHLEPYVRAFTDIVRDLPCLKVCLSLVLIRIAGY
ncbi:MAG: GH3 auxin-responsive promoter family protein [Synergistaceae bacterium]|nr:GH3 auxin-responsive promoter family protein [Synergistaceae bacterium]